MQKLEAETLTSVNSKKSARFKDLQTNPLNNPEPEWKHSTSHRWAGWSPSASFATASPVPSQVTEMLWCRHCQLQEGRGKGLLSPKQVPQVKVPHSHRDSRASTQPSLWQCKLMARMCFHGRALAPLGRCESERSTWEDTCLLAASPHWPHSIQSPSLQDSHVWKHTLFLLCAPLMSLTPAPSLFPTGHA